jgi:hypothetical protein
MSHNMIESMVRQRLREKNGQVYCADCLAKDLEQDPTEVKAAMDVLTARQTFAGGLCPCGKTGLMLRWEGLGPEGVASRGRLGPFGRWPGTSPRAR